MQAYNCSVANYFENSHHWNLKATIASTKLPTWQPNEYYLFGAPMPGRQFNSTDYDYGFGGKRKDDEISGNGNSIDFGDRELDTRLGRWWSRDPLSVKYPELSPYSYVANNPIMFTDYEGREIIISFIDKDQKPQTIVYTAGMVANSGNTFVDDAITTLNTLSNGSETAKSIINKAIETKQKVVIGYTSKDANGYDPSVNKDGTYSLSWNPAIGDVMPDANPLTGEKVQAPGITLSHELNHFTNHAKLLDEVEKSKVTAGVNYEQDANYINAKKALDTYEYNPESDEDPIVVPNETKVATDFKMGTRKNYDVIPKKTTVTGPMSTKPDGKKEYNKKLKNESKQGAGSKASF